MRLVTRADFDGLACGAIITLMEDIDSHLFVEPKFMQDGMVEIRSGDIIANLPYHPDCSLWFDHHITNNKEWGFDSPIVPGKGGFRLAPSAARVVYEYYATEGGRTRATGKRVAEGIQVLQSERMRYMLDEADRIDAATLAPEDVLHPAGYVLVSMTIDGKRIEDEPYWLRLMAMLRDAPLDTILSEPEVKRRCQEILNAQETLKKILLERTTLTGNVILTDLRGIQEIPDGNRFLVYTLFPAGNISVKIAEDGQRPNMTAISVGYNIFNSTSRVNVGELLQRYGGGGHRVVGSSRVPTGEAEKALAEILQAVREGR